jgi:D-threo-aldose 1-dehydrogenase
MLHGEVVMKASETRPLGNSGLQVTALGFGGVPLGNLYRPCSDDEARATVRAAYDAGIRLIDTAPLYGFGMSEHRIGGALREAPRDS